MNASSDVFLYDVVTDTTALISHTPGTSTSANNGSGSATISGNGRFVAYSSLATNLVSDDDYADTNGKGDVFLYDRSTGITKLISHTHGSNTSANDLSSDPQISSDGRYVAYVSYATNLAGDDPKSAYEYPTDIFLYDTNAGTTILVSHTPGTTTSGNYRTEAPKLSADGRYITYSTVASNLAGNDSNGLADVFLYDVHADATTLVSHTVGTTTSTPTESISPAISADGRYIAYDVRGATHTHPDDSDGNPNPASSDWDIYLYDRASDSSRLISHAPGTTDRADGDSSAPSISANGDAVAYTFATKTDKTSYYNNNYDVVLWEAATDTTRLVSHTPASTARSNGDSSDPAISPDGRWVAFDSDGTDIAGTHANGRYGTDVFLYDTLGIDLPGTPPSFSTEPQSSSVAVGATASFSVEVRGDPAPAVHWQSRAPGSSEWADVSGADGTSFTIADVTAGQSGTIYRAVATNDRGTIASETATLSVTVAAPTGTAASITAAPVSASVTAGTSHTFAIEIAGDPTPTVQWQSSTDNGSQWRDVPGATAITLSVPNATVAQSGTLYRAVATNARGMVTSAAAMLTVTKPAPEAQQPAPEPVVSAAPTSAAPSSSAPPVVARVAIATKTTLAASAKTQHFGKKKRVTVKVTVAGKPAGSAKIYDGKKLLKKLTLKKGTASYTLSAKLAKGKHKLSVVFTPASPAAYRASTSKVLTIAVWK